MSHRLFDNHRNISLNRLKTRHRFKTRHMSLCECRQLQLKHHRRVRQIPRHAPFGMKFTHKTDRMTVDKHLSTSTGMHWRVTTHLIRRLDWREQGINIGLDIKKIDNCIAYRPLQRLRRAIHHTRYMHRLINAFNGLIRMHNAFIFFKHTPDFKHRNTRSFSIYIEFNHLQQWTD